MYYYSIKNFLYLDDLAIAKFEIKHFILLYFAQALYFN